MGTSINTSKTLGVSAGSKIIAPQTSAFSNTRSTEYDGVDDYVDCGNDSSLQPTGEFSVSCWFKTDVVDGTDSLCIWGKVYFRLQLQGTTGRLVFTVHRNAGQATYLFSPSGTSYYDGNWHHVVTTFKVSDSPNKMKIYVDGALVIESASYNNNVFASTNTFDIGRHFVQSQFMNGNIDEVAFWKTKLTLTEVQDIYNSGVPNDISSYNPISWWRFEEGSGTTATDSGSGGNDGTLINGTLYSNDVP